MGEKLQAGICDDVMETAWSTMWNVTDETPVNCERFLAGGGMYLFLQCKERFPEKADLLRNMMGLLGNVAEVLIISIISTISITIILSIINVIIISSKTILFYRYQNCG